ncbi:MAG: hypothetical protein NC182_07780 [Prevotella sp.]|nr:hypothetical protein [Staphylococcus sp.]MCM1351073.1 hypothetical protein [Prevotella sp.]
MSYKLESVSIKTSNALDRIGEINALWQDILSGKLPLLFDSEGIFQKEISPVAKYHQYESDASGEYMLTIMGVTNDFFKIMEEEVQKGSYIKIDESGENVVEATQKAWHRVWTYQQDEIIHRSFLEDFESSVPSDYTEDKKAHCYLYISIK